MKNEVWFRAGARQRNAEGARGIVNLLDSPYVRLRSIDIDAVEWADGFWARKLALCHEVMVPGMWDLLKDPEISHAYTNFRIAAGRETGHHRGPMWNDGDFYKWLEAAAMVYALKKDTRIGELMGEAVSVIAAAQQDDGYLHTPVIIKRRNGDMSARPFVDPDDFEMYNLGHLMTTACIHHRATGNSDLLAVAVKASDYLCTIFADPDPALARNAVCPSHYMGIIEMYRTTGERKYLELAEAFFEMRDLVESGTDHNQSRVAFSKQRKAVGHAVRANYLYAGAADLYAENGDPAVLRTLVSVWENMALAKVYVTGATGALYDGASPDGSSDHEEIGLVHQAYGREYQLPNVTAHNESCATIGNVLWSWRMLLITAEARYAEMMETALYNGVLATVGLDGESYFYVNTLRRTADLPFELRWSRRRTAYISCFCCPPNIVRTIAEAGSYACLVCEQGLWMNIYGSCRIDVELPSGVQVALAQTTDYPWDGAVRMSMELSREAHFRIFFRIPSWAKGAALCVNGEETEQHPVPGAFFSVDRTWRNKDVVDLSLPMRIQLLEAHPLVEEARNQTAVKRGPLIYCLESMDLPDGVEISEVAIPRDTAFTPVPDFSVADEKVTALEAKALVLRRGDWTGELYREIPRGEPEEARIRLIPYYAWGNRGGGEMTVWIPVRQP